MKYTKEQRKDAKCYCCGVNLGEQSKREQWRKGNCYDCGEKANNLAIERDIDFGAALDILKEQIGN